MARASDPSLGTVVGDRYLFAFPGLSVPIAAARLSRHLAFVALLCHFETTNSMKSYSPEQGNGSAYDAACDRWKDNRMEKNGSGNNGTLAWIDTSGGWPASVRTTEWVMDYGITNIAWTKKLYGKNSRCLIG